VRHYAPGSAASFALERAMGVHLRLDDIVGVRLYAKQAAPADGV